MADEIYTDIDDLFERWAIMTTDGKQGDIGAMRYCLAHCDFAIAQVFTQRIGDITASRDFLTEYIDNGKTLIPCNDDSRPLINIYKDKTQKELGLNPDLITSSAQLKTWKAKGVTVFAIVPPAIDHKNNLLILDLDKGDAHANSTDGIENFRHLIATTNLNPLLRAYLTDFPVNFPCYVETPHSGIHVYFRADCITDKIKQAFDNSRLNGLNIEIKYSTQCTVAGSIKKGKRYVMRGLLENAPSASLPLLTALAKAKKPQMKYTTPHKTYSHGQKWNDTPQKIIDYAESNYAGLGGHDFAWKTAVLYKNAGYDETTALDYIERTNKHQSRKEQYDTKTAVHSIFARR